jgi:hypothetical protein
LINRKTQQELAELAWVQDVAVFCRVREPQQVHLAQVSLPSVSFAVMHQRLAHANKVAVVKACDDAGITFSKKEVEAHHCEACHTSKAKDFIPKTTTRVYKLPMELVRVDVIVHDAGHLGYRYTTHSIDVATGYHWLKFSRDKGAAQKIIKQWVIQMETQTSLKARQIGFDGGPEFGQGTTLFQQSSIRKWLEKRGTILSVTTPHTSWSGASEAAGRASRLTREHFSLLQVCRRSSGRSQRKQRR